MSSPKAILKILSWNIHKCIGGVDRRYRPERVISVLKAADADVLTLQEVDEGAKRSQFDRQVDLLGDSLGYLHRVYSVTHRLKSKGHYGNAILSRFPMEEEFVLDLTLPKKKVRSATMVKLHTGELKTVHLVNLHLGLGGEERQKQIEKLIQKMNSVHMHSSTPCIVAGDFNDVRGVLAKQMESAGFKRVSRERTFPAWSPVFALDAFYVRGNVSVEQGVGLSNGVSKTASDHRPILFTLAFERSVINV